MTFGYDIFATLLFSSEVIAKIRIKGLMTSHTPVSIVHQLTYD